MEGVGIDVGAEVVSGDFEGVEEELADGMMLVLKLEVAMTKELNENM